MQSHFSCISQKTTNKILSIVWQEVKIKAPLNSFQGDAPAKQIHIPWLADFQFVLCQSNKSL